MKSFDATPQETQQNLQIAISEAKKRLKQFSKKQLIEFCTIVRIEAEQQKDLNKFLYEELRKLGWGQESKEETPNVQV